MNKVYVEQSFAPENPLENMGIVIKTKDSAEFDISEYEDWHKENIYCYSHSGRVFSNNPFSDKWDSGIYGLMFIPKDFFGDNNYKESVKKLFEEFTDWAEGDVYDITYCKTNNPDYTIDNVDTADLMLEKICFYSMYLNEEKNQELLDFIKENKIKKNEIEEINESELFEEFRSRYVGRNILGYIKKNEIYQADNENYSEMEMYGYSKVLDHIKTSSSTI